LPVQRPMVLACPEDRASWAFEDQFFFGDELLVAPCLRADGRVNVYLPAGDWVWFPSCKPIKGGRSLELTLSLAEMAVFARAGTRLPLADGRARALTDHSPTVTEWIAPAAPE